MTILFLTKYSRQKQNRAAEVGWLFYTQMCTRYNDMMVVNGWQLHGCRIKTQPWSEWYSLGTNLVLYNLACRFYVHWNYVVSEAQQHDLLSRAWGISIHPRLDRKKGAAKATTVSGGWRLIVISRVGAYVPHAFFALFFTLFSCFNERLACVVNAIKFCNRIRMSLREHFWATETHDGDIRYTERKPCFRRIMWSVKVFVFLVRCPTKFNSTTVFEIHCVFF